MNATASLLADTVCRTVELGVTITDAAVVVKFTHLFCAPVTLDPTSTIITRTGEDSAGEVHDRMPVFLTPVARGAWLKPGGGRRATWRT